MTFFSIFLVLLIEQFKAAPARQVSRWLAAYTAFIDRQFNGGERRHGKVGWAVGVAVPVLAVLLAEWGLYAMHPLLMFAFSVLTLYFVMGFRQFSHSFTALQAALREGDLAGARQLFRAWTGRDASRLGSAEIARLTIETGIQASHQHVFAPLFWFAVLGPAGAVLYRLSLAMQLEGTRSPDAFGAFAVQAFSLLDWVPVRITAMVFAVVGDFEDAIYCWRTQAGEWRETASGILLASGAGALGVRLGQPLPEALGLGLDERPELGLGDEVGVEHLQSAIGLMWRALVLILLLLALLTLASWVGS